MQRTLTALVAFLMLILGCGVVAAQTSETIRLTTGEWQPYFSKDVPHHGFAAHIVTEAFALVDVEVEYGFFPWGRAYKLANVGSWDGSAVWIDTEDRRKDFLYSDPVVLSTTVFFHLKNTNFDWDKYDDLRDVRIGGTLKYAYGTEFDKAEAAGIIKTNRAPNDETNLKKLLKGRIDVFIGNIAVTYAQIREIFTKEQATQFTHHDKPVSIEPLHLLLSKKAPTSEQVLARFNEGLRRLKESGRYDQIIADALAGIYTKPK
jgi:polar amino acid transport system substrate-binding protein